MKSAVTLHGTAIWASGAGNQGPQFQGRTMDAVRPDVGVKSGSGGGGGGGGADLSNPDTLRLLRSLAFCPEAVAWAEADGGTAAQLWDRCDRGDWLIWLAEGL